MAYTLRYYKTIPQPGERDILLQIYEKDGTRSAMEIGDVIQALHLDIQGSQDDIDTPIIKTSLTMTFVDAPDHADAGVMKCGDWQEFYTPDSTYWKVILMARNASGSFTEIWGGYITPDSFSEQLRYRGSVTIVARDNIGHMQDFPFDATGNEDGMITVYDLVNAAWAKIESPMRIDWRGMADSALWLQCDGTDAPSAYVNVSAFDGMNWYDAVEKVLYSMGMVMRYIGMNIVQVSSLRYMPNQGMEFISDLPVIEPKFIAYASRELAPAVKRVEESSSYDLTDGKAAPLADGVAFSGVQGSSPFYSEDVFGEQTTFNIPVWPIANSGDLGWSNIPNSTLFLDPSRYSLSGDLVDDADRLIFLAGNTGDSRAVSYGLRMVCRDFRVDMKIGRVVERFNSTSLGYAWFVWAKQVRCYLSVEQNNVTHFFTGTGWQTDAYLLNIDVVDGGISLDVPLADFSGSAIVKLTIQEIVLGWKIGDVSDGAGLYVAIESLKFTGAEGSLLKTNRVNTNFNESNNVIITRDPALSPAMNEVPFPQMIKNGIFVLQDSAYLPAKLWAWAWSGETPQQMAVYNHLQLLSYYAKPNNVITGDIVNANLGDIRAIYVWHGREHLLQGGSLNFLNGRIEGAILREFNRYEDLWGDVTGDAGLPDVESTSTTNAEAGSSSTAQNYDKTTEVYLFGSGDGSGSSTLAGLSDVRITSPTDSQILAYDYATGRWVNKTISIGGGGEAYTLPLASYSERGGIKIGYNESYSEGIYYDIPLELSSNEAAFIHLTSDILQEVLGYTPLASDAFTKANIKSVLGIADWALEANKPSYTWNEIDGRPTALSAFTNDLGLSSLAYKSSLVASDIPSLPWSKITSGKPTTLEGYGITDAILYQGAIDLSSAYRSMGYGHASKGWRTSGPAVVFGDTSYNLAMQCAITNADYVSLYVRNKYNGVEYGWDRIVTEGLLSRGAISFDTSAYKCRGDIVLHRNTDDGVTFLNFGPANSDKAALQAFGQNITFYAGVASAYDSYLILDGNLGNVQVRKPLHLSQTLYTKTIFAEGPVILRTTSGDRYFRSRSIDEAGAVIAEIGFGVSNDNVSRGIYDYTNGRWLLINYGDGRVVYQGDKFLVKTTEVYDPKDGGTTPIRLGGGVRIDGSLYLPNSGQVKIANLAGDKDLIIFQLKDNNDFLVGQKTAAEGYDTYLYGNALHFKINTGATELLTLTEGGNVGIGETNPTFKLDINGQLNSANFVAGTALTSDPTESFQTTVFGSNDSYRYKMRLMRPGSANFGRVATPYATTLCLKSADTHGYISIPYPASNKNKCYIGGGNDDKINWKGALFHDNMDLLPKDDGAFYLGSTDKRWKALNVIDISVAGNIIPQSYGVSELGSLGKPFRYIYGNALSSAVSGNNLWLIGGDGNDSIGVVFARNTAGDFTGELGRWNASGLYPANDTTPLGLDYYRWDCLYTKSADVKNSIKIGDAIISWDATAGMLKFDKGLYSVGAITAGKKSSGSQSSGSQSSASAEWYNIKTKRLTNEDTIATDIYNIIENFDERLLDTDKYRIVLMTYKRKKGQGFGWRIPMFSPRYNADSGEILNEATPCAIAWNNTWWPAQSSETLVLNQTGANITEVINIGANTDRFARSNSKKIRIGFAIFKKTLDSDGNPVGTWGWQRVSNIAEIMLYYAEFKQITMVRVIE